MLWRRKHIAGELYHTAYKCWLEKEIDAKRIDFPGGIDAFVANREMACNADFRGPPKPQADDLKTAKAYEVLYGLGVVTQQQIASDTTGADIVDVRTQLASEAASRQEDGLPEPAIIAPPKPEPDAGDDKPDTEAE